MDDWIWRSIDLPDKKGAWTVKLFVDYVLVASGIFYIQ
jgi:hypothetical protein